jgi:hypothetical protein
MNDNCACARGERTERAEREERTDLYKIESAREIYSLNTQTESQGHIDVVSAILSAVVELLVFKTDKTV